jgi:AcrR family transcriptional regulator
MPSPAPGGRRRVPALPTEERQRALIAATVPLLREHGAGVSTRQIADAAGVAEGTIFRVFPDKASLLRATVVSAFDPAPLLDELGHIDPALDLHARVGAVIGAVRGRLTANAPLLAITRDMGGTRADTEDFLERLKAGRKQITAAVADVLRPDQERLRRDPGSVAQLLIMLVMSTVHNRFTEPGALGGIDDDELASLLLDGLLVRPAGPDDPTGARI